LDSVDLKAGEVVAEEGLVEAAHQVGGLRGQRMEGSCAAAAGWGLPGRVRSRDPPAAPRRRSARARGTGRPGRVSSRTVSPSRRPRTS
jgi:hypothetical protein